jgi:hypothetical protein
MFVSGGEILKHVSATGYFDDQLEVTKLSVEKPSVHSLTYSLRGNLSHLHSKAQAHK